MSTTLHSLPADCNDQIYVSVRPIVAGDLCIPLNIVFEDSEDEPDSNSVPIPAFSFLITHPTHGHILFDLGVRKNCEGYPPKLHDRIYSVFKAVCAEDVADQLINGGVQPEEIKTVILSHLHWDHIGDPSRFPNADLVLGAGTKGLLSTRVYPENPEGVIPELPQDKPITFIDFDSATTPSPSKRISPFATFTHAIDFYGDGSLYLVLTPGHTPGHMSAVTRIAPDTFLFLGGDVCHHKEGYAPGTRPISKRMHEDIGTSRDTIRRLATLYKELPNVMVIIAHEAEKVGEGLPLFPNDVKDWVLEQVEKRKAGKNNT